MPAIKEDEINGFIAKAPIISRLARWMIALVEPQVGQGIPETVLSGQRRGILTRGRNLPAKMIRIANPP